MTEENLEQKLNKKREELERKKKNTPSYDIPELNTKYLFRNWKKDIIKSEPENEMEESYNDSDRIPEVITGRHIIGSGIHNINHDILVKDSGTLIIEADAKLYFSDGKGIYVGNRSEKGGTINISGTSSYPVRLEAKMDNWNGITLENTKKDNIIKYAIIQDAKKEAGGGIFAYKSNLGLEDITIENCKADKGGGICNVESDVWIEDSTVRNNHAKTSGGGIFNYKSETRIVNTSITKNRSEQGGGIQATESQIKLVDNRITENYAKSEGGGIDFYKSTIIQSGNNIIENNAPNNIYEYKQYKTFFQIFRK